MAIDPQGSSLTDGDDAWTTSDPTGKTWPEWIVDRGLLRLVPPDAFELAWYDRAYGTIRRLIRSRAWPGAAVAADESQTIFPSGRAPRQALGFVYSDTKLATWHCACGTRPAGTDPPVRSNARYHGVFNLPDRDDRKVIGGMVGMVDGQLLELLGSLERYGFLWIDTEERTILPAKPLRL